MKRANILKVYRRDLKNSFTNPIALSSYWLFALFHRYMHGLILQHVGMSMKIRDLFQWQLSIMTIQWGLIVHF